MVPLRIPVLLDNQTHDFYLGSLTLCDESHSKWSRLPLPTVFFNVHGSIFFSHLKLVTFSHMVGWKFNSARNSHVTLCFYLKMRALDVLIWNPFREISNDIWIFKIMRLICWYCIILSMRWRDIRKCGDVLNLGAYLLNWELWIAFLLENAQHNS